MKLNEKIVFYRKRMGLSQEALAEKIGVSRQAVSKWELGDASPEIDKLAALSEVFGVSIDSLVKEGTPESTAERSGTGNGFEEVFRTRYFRRSPMERILSLIKRYGYLAGFILSAYGLGVLGIGLLARFGFKSILSPVLGGGFGGAGFWNDAVSSVNPMRNLFSFSGMEGPFRFPLIFAGLIIAFGTLMILGGLILAFVLKKRGNKQ